MRMGEDEGGYFCFEFAAASTFICSHVSMRIVAPEMLERVV